MDDKSDEFHDPVLDENSGRSQEYYDGMALGLVLMIVIELALVGAWFIVFQVIL